MKPRHIAMGVALVVAAGFAFFGDRAPAGDVVEAAPRNANKAAPSAATATAGGASNISTVSNKSTGASKNAVAAAPVVLALVPRERLMGEGAGADSAFAVQNWTPPPPPPPKPGPQPAPVAPPLPFVYLGKILENGVWEVFLARGNETLIVRKQTVIDGAYRVDAIAPPSMTMTYLPLKQVQQINIGVPE